MKKIIQLIFIALFISISTNAQEIVSTDFLESRTVEELQSQFFQTFNNGVDMYRVLYKTTDIHGVPDTASGLLIIPDDPAFIYPLLCYQHGTVDSRWDVPSQLAGGYELAMALSGKGYAVVAPDYLGLGEARGTHPYVHAETEARAAIDMLFAARQFANENTFLSLNNQLFLTGYSQGGHAALAAHKFIQQDYSNDFTVTASAPMSGPYSVSEKMIDFTLGDVEYNFVAYIAWTSLSYNLDDNIFTNLNEIFKAPYVPFIEQFENEEITLNELNTALISTLIEENGAGQSKPKLMIQDDILDAILNDPTHPMSISLAKNDLIDWVPEAPTRFFGCSGDDQVTFENALYANEVMNANGATDVEVLDVNPPADHGGCVLPAVINTINFFAEFQQIGILSNTKDLLNENPLIDIQPNPTSDYVNIKLTEFANSSRVYKLSLYTINGKLLNEKQLIGNEILSISVADLSSGIYLLQITGEERSYTQKVVRN